jgi:hypothetical protein
MVQTAAEVDATRKEKEGETESLDGLKESKT